MKNKVIIIGSGFGGLSAGCRLLARGYEVEIFEKRDQAGGCAYVYDINGFKFDGSPALLHSPHLFDEIFKAAGQNQEDYLKFIPLDPYYRIFDPNQKVFNYNNDLNNLLEQIKNWEPKDRDSFRKYSSSPRALWNSRFTRLAEKPFGHFLDMLKILPDLFMLQPQFSAYAYISRFIKHEYLRQVFSFNPLLMGSNPFGNPDLFTLPHHLEKQSGAYYVLGGNGAIIQALVQLFERMGGTIHYGTEVKQILTVGRRVTGIRREDGSVLQADYVVSNADVAYTYMALIEEKNRRKYKNRRIKNFKYSPSLFVIYFGTRQRYPDSGLAHHNILFTPGFKAQVSAIFNHHKLPDDFWLYLHMPTFSDDTIAPAGSESFCVISPVPHLDADIDWATMARPYRDRILQFLEENYLPNLRANIIAEHYIDPPHFQNTLNHYLGSAFSIQPTFFQSAWFRPHNCSEDFSNLYFVGAGTHPGPGIANALNSAKIVEDLIAASR